MEVAMEFRQNADIQASGGTKLGSLDRVVLDPHTKEVIAIVVRKGPALSEDKIVPLDLIASADEKRVRLRQDAGSLAALPAYEEKHFVVVDEHELIRELGSPGLPLYWYPPYLGPTASGLSPGYSRPAYALHTDENIPAGTVALHAGARVVDQAGETVGSVEKVLTDPQANRATHFVISRGLLLKERKLVPTTWVEGVGEETVRLAVRSPQVEQLRPYEG
jgi:uncharacterized protein YrrD